MVSATHPMTRDAQMQDGVEGGGLVPVLDFHGSKSWWRNLEFKILSKKWSHTTELWVPEQIPSSLLGCCKASSAHPALCSRGVHGDSAASCARNGQELEEDYLFKQAFVFSKPAPHSERHQRSHIFPCFPQTLTFQTLSPDFGDFVGNPNNQSNLKGNAF